MDKIKSLFNKYKELILYVIVGCLTTVVAIASLFLFNSIFNIRVEISNIFSWVCAVIFSFILNKLVVFKSNAKDTKTIFKELLAFASARLVSLAVDEAIMIIGVNVLNVNTYICKVFSEVFVILINYFFSKFVVFKKK